MNIHRIWIPAFFSAALALLAALASGDPTRADDYDCTGSLGAAHVDNLRVPDGAACTLNGTIVDGNIFVESNATLHAYAVHVDGNIQAGNAARVNVYSNSFVGGSIQIVQSGAADIQAVDINGDLYFDDNNQFLNAANNTINGNLQAFQNSGGVSINGNSIDGNLQCKENTPPPTGSGNIVRGSMEDQCANMGGVPTPAATSTLPAAATSTPSIDREAPTVQWIAPVPAGERYDLREGEQVLLVVEANDNRRIGEVRFLRWDAVNEQYIIFGNLADPPYRVRIRASVLNPGWNQVFVIATDLAGNRSDSPFIWLYKIAQGKMGNRIYLPFARK